MNGVLSGASLLVLVALGPYACGAPATATDVAGTSQDVLVGDGGLDAAPEVTVADVVACDLGGLVTMYAETVQPFTGPCRTCHDATEPPGLLKAPGTPWYYPGDASMTVAAILDHGLVDARRPWVSKFATKPFGLVAHGGGAVLDGVEGADIAFGDFVVHAAPCLGLPWSVTPPARER